MVRRWVVLCAVVMTVVSLAAAPAARADSLNDAFGDSVAAGLGLTPLANPTADDTSCGRSSQSYSAIATALAGATNQNFACSGNTTDYVYNQIAKAKNYPNPNYVTLTIGANDVNWSQWVSDCMAQANCGGTATQTAFTTQLAAFKPKLQALLQTINSQFAPHQILVTGYYSLFGTDKSCGVPYGITTAEAGTIDSRIQSLDTAISAIVQTVPHATYVPVDFGGQGICTANGPVQPATSATWGHPTLLGSQQIANAILSKVQ